MCKELIDPRNTEMLSNISSLHWADREAQKVIKHSPNKKVYVTASGITPSGTVHMGNFREISTVHLVTEALKDAGVKTRFIYSWDDFDRFRKVPGNLKEIAKKLEKHIGEPVADIPDYYGCHKSYAMHFQTPVLEDVKIQGIKPEFLYQHKIYRKGTYAKGIKTALNNIPKLKTILNQYRKIPLGKEWWPAFIYCEKCNKDSTNLISYDNEYTIEYSCECGFSNTFDFRKKGQIKLKWRIDWPMRWDYYNEDFEPAGKDHMSAGSSYMTGIQIQEKIYGSKAPYGFMYENVRLKGMGGKMSGSKGNVLSIRDFQSIYLPSIINYYFAGTKPQSSFQISMDEDLLKVYEDYYYCERIHYGAQKGGVSKRDQKHWKRVYELSNKGLTMSKTMPIQPRLRQIIDTLQTYSFEKAIKNLTPENSNKFDEQRIKDMSNKLNTWIKNHAPKEYVYNLMGPNKDFLKNLTKEEKTELQNFAELLKNVKTEKEVVNVCKTMFSEGVNQRRFFNNTYQLFFQKNKGPRLAAYVSSKGTKMISEFILKQV